MHVRTGVPHITNGTKANQQRKRYAALDAVLPLAVYNEVRKTLASKAMRPKERRTSTEFLPKEPIDTSFLGKYTEGPRRGDALVAKVFKNGAVYEDNYFESDDKVRLVLQQFIEPVSIGLNPQ